MNHRFFLALSAAFCLAWPAYRSGAQTPYSPASPPNTSNPFAGVAAPVRSAPPRQPMQGQPGVPTTSLAAVPGGFVTASQVMTSEPVDPNHKLGRGDVLSYRVEEDRDDKVWPLQVDDSGEIDLPLGGRIKAAGKTTDQLRADIKGLLEREYYYHATVSMGLTNMAQRSSRGRVFVSGAVRQTGFVELPLDSPLTASEAIYQMGGPVDFSNLKRTRVMRKGGPEKGIPVNVKAVEDGKLDQDVVLQAGDHIVVPQAGIGIKF